MDQVIVNILFSIKNKNTLLEEENLNSFLFR